MAKNKGRSDCDAGPLKATLRNMSDQDSVSAFQSQLAYLQRRFGLPPLRAAVVASLIFPEARQ